MEERNKNTIKNLVKSPSSDTDKDSNIFLTSDDKVNLGVPLKYRIKTLLHRLGMSQNELAGEVGISTGSMSQIVNGLWHPSADTKIKMAKVLQCDSIVLFGDSRYWTEYNEVMKYGGNR